MAEVTAAPTSSPAPTSSGGAPSSPAPSGPSSGAAPAAGGAVSTTSSPGGGAPKRTIADQIPDKNHTSAAPKAAEVDTKPPPPQRKKYTFKVDGSEQILEMDDTEVHARLQKAMAAEKRLQEASQLKRKIEDAIQVGKEDPARAFKEAFGVDLDEWAEKRLEERYREATMDPHEREKLELQRKIEQYEAEKRTTKETEQTQLRQAYEKKVWEETEKSLVDAVAKTGFDEGTARHILPFVVDAAQANIEYNLGLTPEHIAAEARRTVETLNRSIVGGMKGDTLLSYLGDDVVKEVIRARLEKSKFAQPEAAPAPSPKVETERDQKPKQTINSSQFIRKHLLGL